MIIRTRKEAVKTVEIVEPAKTARAGKDSKKSKDGEYPKNLARVLCTRYPITFWKKFVPVSALFNSSSEVNTIHPTFAQELGLPIMPTDVGAQKIDNIILNTYEMVVVAFSMMDKANQVKFLKRLSWWLMLVWK